MSSFKQNCMYAMLSLFLLCCPFVAYSQFVTTWKATGGTITIPTLSGETYNYNVTWTNMTNPGVSNGSITGQTGNCTINLQTDAIYQISITGLFPAIHFGNNAIPNASLNRSKILTIAQWGTNPWTSMESAFSGCSNLQLDPVIIISPNLSGVTSMKNMFSSCITLIGNNNMNNWNTSNITNMESVFGGCQNFNQNIGSWQTDNVTNMTGMFAAAYAFNQNIGSWQTDNVTNMTGMFTGCTNFNQNIGNWNMGSVTIVSYMFFEAPAFNNNNSPDINNWNTSNITNMEGMFWGAHSFNQPVGNWNTSNVTNMSFMFAQEDGLQGQGVTTAFNQPINFNPITGSWNTSNVTTMHSMFAGATSFNQPINNWNTSNVMDMSGMFAGATSFNRPLSNWNTSNVQNMALMFVSAVSFNQNLENWNVTSLGIGIGNGANYMFGYSGIDIINYDAILISWAGQNVQQNISLGSQGLKYCAGQSARNHLITSKNWNISGDALGTASDCAYTNFITTWRTTDTQITIPTFPGATYNYTVAYRQISPTIGSYTTITGLTGNHTITGLTNGSTYEVRIGGQFPRFYMNNNSVERGKLRTIEQWGNQVWTSMGSAFLGCGNLTYNTTDIPNLTNVTDMSSMFADCTTFDGNTTINNWVTNNVTNMNATFRRASAFNQPLNSWNTGNVTTMLGMFQEAILFNQPLGGWNTSNVTNMRSMFRGASAFNQPLNSWNTGNVTDMTYMFAYASTFNQDLSNWNTALVQSMGAMFLDATSFNQRLSNWNISSITNMANMLDGTALSRDNYDHTLIGWAAQVEPNGSPANVPLGALGLEYCAGKDARELLLKFGWVIDGDIYTCQNAFITTWQTNQKMFTIPTDPNLTYEYTIKYRQISPTVGSFTSASFQTGDFTVYPADPNAVYEVHILGTFPHFYMGVNNPSRTHLRTIEQWGTQQWASMNGAFRGCTNLISNATDAPDLSNVTDLSFMFMDCISLQGNLGYWNTSTITTMEQMFTNAKSFNQSLGNWNINNVWNMKFMLDNSGLLKDNYDQTLIGWSQQNVQSNVELGSLNLNFCNAANERGYLISTYGWTISGDNYNCLASRSANPSTLADNASEVVKVKENVAQTSVYPNPSRGEFNVELGETAKNTPYNIYNVQGAKVMEGTLETSNTLLKTNLASGVLFYSYLQKWESGG